MNSHDAEQGLQEQGQKAQLQQQKEGTTFLRTCFNGINTLSGIGILSIPYALSQGGWLSLIILFLVAIICYYTGLLQQRCIDAYPEIKTYADIGGVAFGRKGRISISVVMNLELYLAVVGLLILEGDNLHKLYPNVHLDIGGGRFKVGGEKVFVLLTALIVLPTTWLKELGWLAYFSLGGIVACLVLVGSTFWIGAIDGVGFHEKGMLWGWSGLPNTVGLYTLCFSGHSVFPTLRNSMKDRGKFSKVLLVSFTLSTIIYGSIAVLGYLMFGDNLASQITLNLPTKKISSKIAIYTTVISPITKYAILMYPIATSIEQSLHTRKNSRIMSLLTRTGLVVSTMVVAMAFPYYGYVMTFTGAFLGISVAVLFPCICYLKIYQGFRSYKSLGIESFLIITIIIFGVSILITGTYTSIRDITYMFTKQK